MNDYKDSRDELDAADASAKLTILNLSDETKTGTSASIEVDKEISQVADTDESKHKQDAPGLVIIHLDVLREITNVFSDERIVGKGSCGLVYKGIDPDGTEIAVKRLAPVTIPKEDFIKVAEQLTSLQHRNVVKFVGYCHDEAKGEKVVRYKGKDMALRGHPEQLLCFKFLPKGSLHEHLFGKEPHQVDWHIRYNMIKGMCEGLHYLHEVCQYKPMVHFNLSLSNVLLDNDHVPHITDSNSWLIGEKANRTLATTMGRQLTYMAPEYRQGGATLQAPSKADIYSLGVMILEIVTREQYLGQQLDKIAKTWTQESHIASVYESQEPDILQQVQMCVRIGLDCVEIKADKRPTAGDIILKLNQERKTH